MEERMHTSNSTSNGSENGRMKMEPDAFLLFFLERRKQISASHPKLFQNGVVKLVGDIWNNLPEVEKAPYLEEAIRLAEECKLNYPDQKCRKLKRKDKEIEPVKPNISSHTQTPSLTNYQNRFHDARNITNAVPNSLSSHGMPFLPNSTTSFASKTQWNHNQQVNCTPIQIQGSTDTLPSVLEISNQSTLPPIIKNAEYFPISKQSVPVMHNSFIYFKTPLLLPNQIGSHKTYNGASAIHTPLNRNGMAFSQSSEINYASESQCLDYSQINQTENQSTTNFMPDLTTRYVPEPQCLINSLIVENRTESELVCDSSFCQQPDLPCRETEKFESSYRANVIQKPEKFTQNLNRIQLPGIQFMLNQQSNMMTLQPESTSNYSTCESEKNNRSGLSSNITSGNLAPNWKPTLMKDSEQFNLVIDGLVKYRLQCKDLCLSEAISLASLIVYN